MVEKFRELGDARVQELVRDLDAVGWVLQDAEISADEGARRR